MDYKPYEPFHYNGKDFVKLAVTCQVLQDMEKRGAQTGTNNNKFQRCKTKDKGTRKSRQHILYLLCFNCGTVYFGYDYSIDCSAFHIKNPSGCRISTGNRMDFFLLMSGTIF